MGGDPESLCVGRVSGSEGASSLFVYFWLAKIRVLRAAFFPPLNKLQ